LTGNQWGVFEFTAAEQKSPNVTIGKVLHGFVAEEPKKSPIVIKGKIC
jgi:hypothetical protein